jgi:hypothetical protein
MVNQAGRGGCVCLRVRQVARLACVLKNHVPDLRTQKPVSTGSSKEPIHPRWQASRPQAYTAGSKLQRVNEGAT